MLEFKRILINIIEIYFFYFIRLYYNENYRNNVKIWELNNIFLDNQYVIKYYRKFLNFYIIRGK